MWRYRHSSKTWTWSCYSLLLSSPAGDPPLHQWHQNPPVGQNFLHTPLWEAGKSRERSARGGQRWPAPSPTEQPLSSFALIVFYQRGKVTLQPLHRVKSQPEVFHNLGPSATLWIKLCVNETTNRGTRSRVSITDIINTVGLICPQILSK